MYIIACIVLPIIYILSPVILNLLVISEQVFVSIPRSVPHASTPVILSSFGPLPQTVGVFQISRTQWPVRGPTPTTRVGMRICISDKQIYRVAVLLVAFSFPNTGIKFTLTEYLVYIRDLYSAYHSRKTACLQTSNHVCS